MKPIRKNVAPVNYTENIILSLIREEVIIARPSFQCSNAPFLYADTARKAISKFQYQQGQAIKERKRKKGGSTEKEFGASCCQ